MILVSLINRYVITAISGARVLQRLDSNEEERYLAAWESYCETKKWREKLRLF